MASVRQNNERIKAIDRSITNLSTETEIFMLDELYRGNEKLLRWHRGIGQRGDSPSTVGGAFMSHVDAADSAHIYTWLLSECKQNTVEYKLWVARLVEQAVHLQPSLPFPRSRQVSLHSSF